MAERGSFFNSYNGDRKYFTQDLVDYFEEFLINGVFKKVNNDTSLQVVSGSGMTLKVKKGSAFINGYRYSNDSDLDITLDNSDTINDRIDLIVVRLDIPNRTISTVVRKGNPGSVPVKPTPITDVVVEIPLASVRVSKGVVTITSDNITDERQYAYSYVDVNHIHTEGAGSGSNSDMVDGYHAEELINKQECPVYIIEQKVYNKGGANEQVVTKYNNGEMEIRLIQTPDRVNITQNYGGFKISDVIPQVNFKEKFIGTPVVTCEVNGRSAGCRVWLMHDWNISVNSNSTMSLLACSGETVTNLTLRIGYIAKGWWK